MSIPPITISRPKLSTPIAARLRDSGSGVDIAQELEAALAKFDTKNNGIISKDDEGMYGVRYNDLIAPMVKAMQEQQAIIDAQAKTIAEILERLKEVENKK